MESLGSLDETEIKWLEVCNAYFMHGDKFTETCLEYFQSIAPIDAGDHICLNVLISAELSMFIEATDMVSAANNPNKWYRLNDIKNYARFSVHKQKSMRRAAELDNQVRAIYLRMTPLRPKELISKNLRRLEILSESNISILSLLNDVRSWCGVNMTSTLCIYWKFSCFLLSERDDDTRYYFVTLLLALGNYEGIIEEEMRWNFRSNFSNAYLQRIISRLLTKLKSNNLSQLRNGAFEASEVARENINGGQDTFVEYACNTLSCPLI